MKQQPVFVCSRNVIPHVILLSYDRHNIVSRIKLKRAMASANNVFNCSLCDVLLRPSECRKVFSSSSEFVLPLLKQVVADVFGKVDKLPMCFF